MINYQLKTFEKGDKTTTIGGAVKSLGPLLRDEVRPIVISLVAVIVNSGANLLSPFIIAYIIDKYIATKDFHGVLMYSGILAVIYLLGLVAAYVQTKVMGGVGRRVLFKLRNRIFTKLQELPVAFFNANKAGDLISRINSDTDKLNQFFSQALLQFFGNIFLMFGAGAFLLLLNVRLGAASLAPALIVIVITQLLSTWINRTSRTSLQALGGMSAEIQESLANFKVVVAFNRLDYFRVKFDSANKENYSASVKAGVASNILTPIYGVASNAAQIVMLAYGIVLIASGNLTVGFLIGFLLYVNNFYTPLRQLASVWSSLQLALASLDRISEVLGLGSDIKVIESGKKAPPSAAAAVLSFDRVFFSYTDDKEVLRDVSFALEKGKTYALVGPTGGGKTTTASLMARLYDPSMGTVYLGGRDIRSYEAGERAGKIGFILQEPFLFSGTVGENILYGNEEYGSYSNEKLLGVLEARGLGGLLARFEKGLDTNVGASDSISLGQKQLVAFIRAVLRAPELLILDEATANIDTVTEQLLEEILRKLPKETTKVIIAHRLNTIENADDIFFVNAGTVVHAGSFAHALEMLMSGKRAS
ncbi:MAG: ABC transporter ATP-binding protein [Candidatus Pacebacteria bacterium]|nr:ABC transporter ATP-binding protein [Candidatus Paceibacterota bacterium]